MEEQCRFMKDMVVYVGKASCINSLNTKAVITKNSQLICRPNQSAGFDMMSILTFSELR